MIKFNQISDFQLNAMVERHYDKLLDEFFDQPDYHCEHCTHYVRSTKQCEWETDDDDFTYKDVNPDDDACNDFELDEYAFDDEPEDYFDECP